MKKKLYFSLTDCGIDNLICTYEQAQQHIDECIKHGLYKSSEVSHVEIMPLWMTEEEFSKVPEWS